jgi:uncharacterized protein (TIGR02466 family)
MQILNLFPTPVGVYDINRELTSFEKDYCNNLNQISSASNKSSEERYVLKDGVMSNLKLFLESSLNDYFQTIYQPTNQSSLRITQSWCNYSNRGESHHAHRHSNSFLSGVFYLQCNEKDSITFHKQQNNYLAIDAKQFNEYNCKTWWIPVKKGTLLLFPSELVHSVNKVNENDTRISLAFNSFPFGTIGDYNSSTELVLS